MKTNLDNTNFDHKGGDVNGNALKVQETRLKEKFLGNSKKKVNSPLPLNNSTNISRQLNPTVSNNAVEEEGTSLEEIEDIIMPKINWYKLIFRICVMLIGIIVIFHAYLLIVQYLYSLTIECKIEELWTFVNENHIARDVSLNNRAKEVFAKATIDIGSNTEVKQKIYEELITLIKNNGVKIRK